MGYSESLRERVAWQAVANCLRPSRIKTNAITGRGAKRFMNTKATNRIFLILVFACAIFAGNGQARTTSRGARLIVQRAPNFGNDRVVQLWIDRRKVAEIPRDQHYEGFVSGGHHTLGVLSLPNTESRQPTAIGLTLRSGRTYIFTATWDSVRGTVLKRSTSASDTTAVKMPR